MCIFFPTVSWAVNYYIYFKLSWRMTFHFLLLLYNPSLTFFVGNLLAFFMARNWINFAIRPLLPPFELIFSNASFFTSFSWPQIPTRFPANAFPFHTRPEFPYGRCFTAGPRENCCRDTFISKLIGFHTTFLSSISSYSIPKNLFTSSRSSPMNVVSMFILLQEHSI